MSCFYKGWLTIWGLGLLAIFRSRSHTLCLPYLCLPRFLLFPCFATPLDRCGAVLWPHTGVAAAASAGEFECPVSRARDLVNWWRSSSWHRCSCSKLRCAQLRSGRCGQWQVAGVEGALPASAASLPYSLLVMGDVQSTLQSIKWLQKPVVLCPGAFDPCSTVVRRGVQNHPGHPGRAGAYVKGWFGRHVGGGAWTFQAAGVIADAVSKHIPLAGWGLPGQLQSVGLRFRLRIRRR